MKSSVIKLGVNIDHVATLRQQRLGTFPSVLEAALVAEEAGASGITAHLREDRRHIQDRDIFLLKKKIRTKLNLEMAASAEMVQIACRLRPADVCLVPEKRRELTTEGGLNVVSLAKNLQKKVAQLQKNKIVVSVFIDPEIDQVLACKKIGAQAVELHTGSYAEKSGSARVKELEKLKVAAVCAKESGLILNAGHGLDYDNVEAVCKISGMHELNIGFSIISRAIFVGLSQAVKEMKSLI